MRPLRPTQTQLAPLGQMSQGLEALASFLTVSEDAPLAFGSCVGKEEGDAPTHFSPQDADSITFA